MSPEFLDQIRIKAEGRINDFCKSFYAEFGVIPKISYHLLQLPDMNLEKLYIIVNEELNNNKFEFSKKSYLHRVHLHRDKKLDILSKRRFSSIVAYRQFFCKICSDIGYGVSSIGRFLDVNHSTVIHAIKTVEKELSVNNVIYRIAYQKLLDRLTTVYESNSELFESK